MPADGRVIEIRFAGTFFRMRVLDRQDLASLKMQEGTFEAPLPILLAGVICRTSGVFIDVGANTGVYSLLAYALKPDQRVIAFEPFPPVLNILRENVRLNSAGERVEIIEVALSDKDGVVPIYIPDQSHGLIESSASLLENFSAGSEAATTVQTRRLDDLSIIDPISVIKVDIEGFELEFLRGADATIRRHRPFIFAEMLPVVSHKFPEITNRLADIGYLSLRLRPDIAILARYIVFDPSAWNYALVPIEKMPVFREICAVHGVEILAPA